MNRHPFTVADPLAVINGTQRSFVASPETTIEVGDRLYLQEDFAARLPAGSRNILPYWFIADGAPNPADYGPALPASQMDESQSRYHAVVTFIRKEGDDVVVEFMKVHA